MLYGCTVFYYSHINRLFIILFLLLCKILMNGTWGTIGDNLNGDRNKKCKLYLGTVSV